jgi:adenylate kinase family enzyme
VQRVSVVGITGSGKTTTGRRLAQILRVPFIELDSIYHQANWKPMERDRFTAMVDELAQGESWVIDGSYRDWTALGSIWRRADTVVWVRPSKLSTLRQLLWRSVRNLVTRRELWHGNREMLREHLRLNPKRSIFAYVLRNYRDYDRTFAGHIREERFKHINFVILRTRAEAEAWLNAVEQQQTMKSSPMP